MHVNHTLAQGLQVLTAHSADKAISDKIGKTSDDLLKTANGISNQASNASKQASTVIGNALLGRSDLNGPMSDEDLRQAARLKAYATGSSWGVERYDSLDEMPSDIRETFAKVDAWRKEEDAKMAKVSGMHHWNEKVSHHLREFMSAAADILNYWSYDANGSVKIAPEKAAGLHSVEITKLQTFEKNLKATVAAVGENANVTGDIFVKNEDGTWSWGAFEVRDKDTGELYFNHNGTGKVQFHDQGTVFGKFNTAGDSWGYEDTRDTAEHQKVFGHS